MAYGTNTGFKPAGQGAALQGLGVTTSQSENDHQGHAAAKNTAHLWAWRLKPWEHMKQSSYSPQHWLHLGCNASRNFWTSNFKVREARRELKDHHNPATILAMLTI